MQKSRSTEGNPRPATFDPSLSWSERKTVAPWDRPSTPKRADTHVLIQETIAKKEWVGVASYTTNCNPSEDQSTVWADIVVSLVEADQVDLCTNLLDKGVSPLWAGKDDRCPMVVVSQTHPEMLSVFLMKAKVIGRDIPTWISVLKNVETNVSQYAKVLAHLQKSGVADSMIPATAREQWHLYIESAAPHLKGSLGQVNIARSLSRRDSTSRPRNTSGLIGTRDPARNLKSAQAAAERGKWSEVQDLLRLLQVNDCGHQLWASLLITAAKGVDDADAKAIVDRLLGIGVNPAWKQSNQQSTLMVLAGQDGDIDLFNKCVSKAATDEESFHTWLEVLLRLGTCDQEQGRAKRMTVARHLGDSRSFGDKYDESKAISILRNRYPIAENQEKYFEVAKGRIASGKPVGWLRDVTDFTETQWATLLIEMAQQNESYIPEIRRLVENGVSPAWKRGGGVSLLAHLLRGNDQLFAFCVNKTPQTQAEFSVWTSLLLQLTKSNNDFAKKQAVAMYFRTPLSKEQEFNSATVVKLLARVYLPDSFQPEFANLMKDFLVKGNETGIEALLKEGVQPAWSSGPDVTPFHVALQMRRLDLFEGARASELSQSCLAGLLGESLSNEEPSQVDYLLQFNVNPFWRVDEETASPLTAACRAKSPHFTRLLNTVRLDGSLSPKMTSLRRGTMNGKLAHSSVSGKKEKSLSTDQKITYADLMQVAIESGFLDGARALMEKGVSLLWLSDQKQSALHTLALHADTTHNDEWMKIVDDWKEKEKPKRKLMDPKDGDGHTPLYRSVENGHTQLAVWLAKKGADLDGKQGDKSPWDLAGPQNMSAELVKWHKGRTKGRSDSAVDLSSSSNAAPVSPPIEVKHVATGAPGGMPSSPRGGFSPRNGVGPSPLANGHGNGSGIRGFAPVGIIPPPVAATRVYKDKEVQHMMSLAMSADATSLRTAFDQGADPTWLNSSDDTLLHFLARQGTVPEGVINVVFNRLTEGVASLDVTNGQGETARAVAERCNNQYLLTILDMV